VSSLKFIDIQNDSLSKNRMNVNQKHLLQVYKD
jgi:hypothetical protein